MPPQPQPQSEWLSKRDAARLLGVSERQIERRAAAGTIRSRRESRRPDQTAAPVLFFRDDVEAIQAGTPNHHPVVEKIPAAEIQASELKAILPAGPGASAGLVLERLAQLLGAARPDPRPWLSVGEASGYSGLPLGFLRRIAPQLEGSGDAVNVSSGSRPRWKIRRAALDGPLARPSA